MDRGVELRTRRRRARVGIVLSPLYLSRAFNLSQAQLGKILWIPLVGWEAGYFFWGWIADKFVTRGQRPTGLFCMLTVLALPTALVTRIDSWPVVLALFFWATFIADGFVVLSLRVGSHLYPRDQTALVGGIGSGSWSAVLALILPVWGRCFDLKWYGAVFISASLFPVLGTALWFWLSRPEKLVARSGSANGLGAAGSRQNFFDDSGFGIGVILDVLPFLFGQFQLGARVQIAIRWTSTQPVAKQQHALHFRTA